MRSWAHVFDGIVMRVVNSDQNPFHSSLRAVEVTGIPAQVGNSVDAVGNIGPSVPAAPADAAARRGSLISGQAAYRVHAGVWLPAGNPDGHLFDTSDAALGRLAALAAASSSNTPAADGSLAELPASDVFAAAGKYLAACYEHEALLRETADDSDVLEGWPDNGEPDEKSPKAAPPPKAATRPAGTGIVPEQTPEAPHADTTLDVVGTVEAPVVQQS